MQCKVNKFIYIHGNFTVAIRKKSNTVGHVSQEISRDCWYFLQNSGSEITCINTSDRR